MWVYNGIAVLDTRTLSFEMVQERDPTNTDAIWNKYTIRVRGFVTTNWNTTTSPATANFSNNTSAVLARIKSQLETPRRAFYYSIGSTAMVSLGSGSPYSTDAKNLLDAQNTNGVQAIDAKLGPEPLPASVREVTSGTYMVECGIIVRQVDCPPCPQSQAPNTIRTYNPVISLRWSQSESFDENWNSRLSTSGRLIVRSDMLQSADLFRQQATPPLLQDYRRISSKYTLSADGLVLDFAYEDVEVDRLPPSPATKATGRFTVLVQKNGMRTGQCDVHLEGPKGTSRRALMVRACQMCYSKISKEGFQTASNTKNVKNKIPIIWGTFREDLFEPVVDVSMSAMLAPLAKSGGGVVTGTSSGSSSTGSLNPLNAVSSTVNAAYQQAAPAPVPSSPSVPTSSAAPVAVVAPTVTGTNAAGETVPVAFRSVGEPPEGTTSYREGIGPPDRKRIAALLVAAFRDPCACMPPVLLPAVIQPPGGVKGMPSTIGRTTNKNPPKGSVSMPASGNPGITTPAVIPTTFIDPSANSDYEVPPDSDPRR